MSSRVACVTLDFEGLAIRATGGRYIPPIPGPGRLWLDLETGGKFYAQGNDAIDLRDQAVSMGLQLMELD